MADTPKVSVIMNCYNGAEYLREAIESVYSQISKDWEIVFWDNASTDSSAEIARSYDGRLRYFMGDRTVPLYAARNLALAKAKGEFISFLDCDDIWLPEKLEKQIVVFEKSQNVGIVYSNTIMFNEHTGRQWLHTKPGRFYSGMVFERLLTSYFLPFLTVAIRRECLKGLKEWFDNRFDIIGDADLFTRISYNWKVDYVPEILAKCRVHEGNLTRLRRDVLGKEYRMMLEKYLLLYPEFSERHGPEMRKLEARTTYFEAIGAWKRGESPSKIREMVIPYLTHSPKLSAFYFLTFLPYSYFEGMLRVFHRHQK